MGMGRRRGSLSQGRWCDGGESAFLVRVDARDFCAGAVYAHDPPICVRAADKLAVFERRGLHRLVVAARANGERLADRDRRL